MRLSPTVCRPFRAHRGRIYLLALSALAVPAAFLGLVAAGTSPATADSCCGSGGGAKKGDSAGGHDAHGGGGAAEPAGEDAHADHGGQAAKTDTAKEDTPQAGRGLTLVDLGNARCPVMGGKPDGKTWSEWKGLRVGHCCGGCEKKFAADPGKALDAAGVEWRAAAEAVQQADQAVGADQERALAALVRKWPLLRTPSGAKAEVPRLLVDLGNAKCPVMGGRPDGRTYSEWRGLRVAHCCPGCVKKFRADPGQALDSARLSWRDAAEAVRRAEEATGEERTKALEALRASKWKVLREPVAGH